MEPEVISETVSQVAPEMSDKLVSAADKKDKIGESITAAGTIILNNFLIPLMVFLLIFLGALNTIYPHESSFEADLNNSLGVVGVAFYKIYDIGAQNLSWFNYFLIILAAFIYFTIRDIYISTKRIWKCEDKTSAQDIIDHTGDTYSDLKGGNKDIK